MGGMLLSRNATGPGSALEGLAVPAGLVRKLRPCCQLSTRGCQVCGEGCQEERNGTHSSSSAPTSAAFSGSVGVAGAAAAAKAASSLRWASFLWASSSVGRVGRFGASSGEDAEGRMDSGALTTSVTV